jgi:hypothetical protein
MVDKYFSDKEYYLINSDKNELWYNRYCNKWEVIKYDEHINWFLRTIFTVKNKDFFEFQGNSYK